MIESLMTALWGPELISSSRFNKGTAFTEHERDVFELHGLLPPHVGTLDQQLQRRLRALAAQPTPFAKYTFLRELQDTNETLFYAALVHNVEEMLPIVYTPTVGEGCQRFSEIWRKPRGLFLSYPNKDRIPQILAHKRYDDVRCIVVSDGERILGLGDQGAGGMGIPIGKLALYTAIGGIRPEHCLPILLDVGTDNAERLEQPQYIGWRSKRVRGEAYDEFVDAFVSAVQQRWPDVLLHWEDFAGANAARFLARYRDQLCTFNDDIQGTAAVATSTLVSAMNITGISLAQQRIVVVGFGSAGVGITNLICQLMQDGGMSEADARDRFYPIDRWGLVTHDGRDVRAEQQPYARQDFAVQLPLEEVVKRVKPTALIGVSGQAGAFTEAAVREMAAHVARPIIFPLSNPTSRSEATPQQLADWSGGRAIVSTGSPFDPVTIGDHHVRITQTNNSYIFPGLALGIIAAKARRVTDGMIMAATKELVQHLPTRTDKHAPLLPPLGQARALSRHIARAVGRQAIRDGQARITDEAALERELDVNIWDPRYVPYHRAR